MDLSNFTYQIYKNPSPEPGRHSSLYILKYQDYIVDTKFFSEDQPESKNIPYWVSRHLKKHDQYPPKLLHALNADVVKPYYLLTSQHNLLDQPELLL